MMSIFDVEEFVLLLALICKRKRRRWMHEISEEKERLGEYHRLCEELQSHEDSRTFSYSFFGEFFRHSILAAWQICLKTQMSAARRDLDCSPASARLLFDGDDAVLHNTVRTPSRRGHRSLPVAAACFLYGRIPIIPVE